MATVLNFAEPNFSSTTLSNKGGPMSNEIILIKYVHIGKVNYYQNRLPFW